jgi:hypothetical protein
MDEPSPMGLSAGLVRFIGLAEVAATVGTHPAEPRVRPDPRPACR